MNDTFITKIKINDVRHLRNININLSNNERKHLILTGKNGSGKTSVLEAIKNNINGHLSSSLTENEIIVQVNYYQNEINNNHSDNEENKIKIENDKSSLEKWKNILENMQCGISIDYISFADLKIRYNSGTYILAYYPANRIYSAIISNTIENIELKDVYDVSESPGEQFIKYMVNMKSREALSEKAKNYEYSKKITEWFERIENLLKRIFDDSNLKLEFNIDSFEFKINQANRIPFNFNELSDGYGAILNIITDLIMRMEKKASQVFDIEGIVIIDEIETHLHLELQKQILPMLTGIFPKIQFIVSTHSPFIINSTDNAILYDLENETLVDESLSNYSYESVVEGYFRVDQLSNILNEKFAKYKELSKKVDLSPDDWNEIAELELYLDEIPDYLDMDFNNEYKQIKNEIENRG